MAFNAMPAALTADMWTHVYVQQSNSVFAGKTAPSPSPPPMDTPEETLRKSKSKSKSKKQNPWTPQDRSLSAHHLDSRHGHTSAPAGCSACGGGGGKAARGEGGGGHVHTVGDNPSGEDQGSNFYGVSHFPCCITNFPQGITRPPPPHTHTHTHTPTYLPTHPPTHACIDACTCSRC